MPRTLVSRDLTFRDYSFLKNDKIIEFQKDGKGKAKAAEVEQQGHDTAMDNVIPKKTLRV